MGYTSSSRLTSAVVDNNILIDLWELGRIDLLFDGFEKVLIPEIIYESEITKEIKAVIGGYSFELATIESLVGYETYGELSSNTKYRNLSQQDKMAVSIAKQEAIFCTSNDGLVRKACVEYEVDYLGILGVLKYTYEEQLIDKKELIFLSRKLLSTSCYITEKVIESFIDNLQ